eukprot:1195374-Prorocentrum_minimum.AAC.8
MVYVSALQLTTPASAPRPTRYGPIRHQKREYSLTIDQSDAHFDPLSHPNAPTNSHRYSSSLLYRVLTSLSAKRSKPPLCRTQ